MISPSVRPRPSSLSGKSKRLGGGARSRLPFGRRRGEALHSAPPTPIAGVRSESEPMAWEGAGEEGKKVGAAAAAPINAVSEQRVEGYRTTPDRLLQPCTL